MIKNEEKTVKNKNYKIYKNYKKGNIEILFLTVLIFCIIIIISITYILYIQINTFVYPIKQDLFYIVQNSYMSLNKEKLSYYEYDINQEILNEKVSKIIKLNYNNVDLEYLKYNKESGNVEIVVVVEIKPFVLSSQIGNIKLKIKDNIKLKMMEVE